MKEIEWSLFPYSILNENNKSILSKKSSAEEIIVNNGRLQIYMLPQDTKDLEGVFIYQLALINNDDSVRIIRRDCMNILKPIAL